MSIVVRTDRLSGTYDGSKLVSAKYMTGDTLAATAIDNGKLVYIDDTFVTGSTEVFQALATDADGAKHTIAGGHIGLVASPEFMPDERKHNLSEFTNAAGDILRVYILQYGDIFGVTAGAFTTVPTSAKKVIELGDAGVMNAVASATTGVNKIGQYLGTETSNGNTYYIVRVCA